MGNSILKKVYEYIKKNKLIEENEHIIVGLSGGADSICLLHILHSLSKTLKIKLTAIHINHMLRGEEAQRDEDFVVDFCNKIGVDVITKKINVSQISKERKLSEEEAGRNARYATFYEYKKLLDADKIATAHNKNDNAETVIMNIIRGTGLSGLKGIDSKRNDIIRPILVLERGEIEDYCNACKLSVVTDSTNKETVYTRNKIRLKLIKEIDDMFNVNITRKINQMSDLVREDNDYLEYTAKQVFSNCLEDRNSREICLNIKKIRKHHKAIIKRVLRLSIGEIKNDINSIENKHIESICGLIDSNKTGIKVELPKKIRAYKDYNILRIYKKEDVQEKFDEVKVDGIRDIKLNNEYLVKMERVEDIKKESLKDTYAKYFDYDKLIKEGFTIRKRRDGDIFKPLNSNGTKKLKKYFIDKKISRIERDNFYLLAKGNEIIWIVRDKISDNYKVTSETKGIIKITFIPIKTK